MARREKKPRQADQSRTIRNTVPRPEPGTTGAARRRTTSSFHRKGLAIVAAVAVISAVASVAVAVSLTTLDAERISLFQGATSSSHFDVATHQLGFQGPVQVIFAVTLTNTDTDPHTANVTAQVLDSDQNVILEKTKSTGEVAAGDSVTLTYIFVHTGLADVFESTFLVVKDQD